MNRKEMHASRCTASLRLGGGSRTVHRTVVLLYYVMYMYLVSAVTLAGIVEATRVRCARHFADYSQHPEAVATQRRRSGRDTPEAQVQED